MPEAKALPLTRRINPALDRLVCWLQPATASGKELNLF